MNEDFLRVAKEAAIEAGKVIQKYSGQVHQKSIKKDDVSDFATEADLEAEELIVSILSKAFPKHNIIAEENEKTQKGSEYTWVIDPIDGTFSFEIGMPFYSVSIGLLKNNKPLLGVIYNVALNQLYWAIDGQGAYLNGNRIHVSKRNVVSEAGAVLDVGHRQRRQAKFNLYIEPLLNKVGYVYSLGSAVAVLALVAQGILDADVNQAWIWDFAAGAVIVREAGGKVTDFEGNEPDWSKERLDIVASNGLIHDEILEALKK